MQMFLANTTERMVVHRPIRLSVLTLQEQSIFNPE
jgi:hypothetical protein